MEVFFQLEVKKVENFANFYVFKFTFIISQLSIYCRLSKSGVVKLFRCSAKLDPIRLRAGQPVQENQNEKKEQNFGQTLVLRENQSNFWCEK